MRATAYNMRPSLRTLSHIERLKEKYFGGQAIAPSTISVHVRHGDKGREMTLLSDTPTSKPRTRCASAWPPVALQPPTPTQALPPTPGRKCL